jgi:hypothetical protein
MFMKPVANLLGLLIQNFQGRLFLTSSSKGQKKEGAHDALFII